MFEIIRHDNNFLRMGLYLLNNQYATSSPNQEFRVRYKEYTTLEGVLKNQKRK